MARLIKRVTEVFEDDDDAEDAAAVDGVVMADTGTLGDSEDEDQDPDDSEAEEPDEEPEARRRSRALATPRRKAR